MSLKILMINHNVKGVGTFHRCCYLARSLTRRGHVVTILTNSRNTLFGFVTCKENQITIIESPDLFFGQLRSGWDPLNALRRFEYLRNEHYDVIHAFDCRPTVIFPALKLRKLWACPLIIDWCDWWGRGGAITLREPKWLNKLFEPIETFFEEHYRTKADHLTTISEPLRERAIALGVKKEKVPVIPPIADLETMYPEDKANARKELGISQDTLVLIFSSFVKYDVELLRAAIEKVFARERNILLIVSGGMHKPFVKMGKFFPIRCVGHVSQEDLRNYKIEFKGLGTTRPI